MTLPNATRTTRGVFRAHPARSGHIERILAARYINFVLEPNFPIDQIRDVEGNQVRLLLHRAPAAMVKRYTEQMNAGAVFPAVVLNDRGELVDGNTRKMASIRSGYTTIAAYVCSTLGPLEARSLSIELNQCHGLSMTEEELRGFVVGAVDEGQVLDTKAYARITGMKPATIARWVAARHFDLRAERQGLPAAEVVGLSTSKRAAIQAVSLQSVFRDVASLASAAKLPAAEVRRIVAKANAAGSESEAREIVAVERSACASRVRTLAAGFTPPKRRSNGAAFHIGGLLRFSVDDLLDVAPERQRDTLERLRMLHARVAEVVDRAATLWVMDGAELERLPDYANAP
jgi:hypothetical protein